MNASFAGKTAFITGGAGGLGLALGERFGALGMRVMLADVDAIALPRAVERLRARGVTVDHVVCDVTEPDSMAAAARATFQRFGNVHLLCNNAGVVVAGETARSSVADWGWVFAVNLMGVVNGLGAFLPGMTAHGETAWIMNTASIAGFRGMPNAGAYCASKAAIVSLSESLRSELQDTNVGVTVLCPGFMKTAFFSGGSRRSTKFGGPSDVWATVGKDVQDHLEGLLNSGHTPETVADAAVKAVTRGQFYVFSTTSDRDLVSSRTSEVMAAFDLVIPT